MSILKGDTYVSGNFYTNQLFSSITDEQRRNSQYIDKVHYVNDNIFGANFEPDWSHYTSVLDTGNDMAPLRFIRDKYGRVLIEGVIKYANTIPSNANTAIFTLPIGYRNRGMEVFPGGRIDNTPSTGIAGIIVDNSVVYIRPRFVITPANVAIAISGVMFLTKDI